MDSTLKTLISYDFKRREKSKKLDFELSFYNGDIFTDKHIISEFPLKYKIEEKLQACKKLIFFLALNYNNTSVKKNRGIFFTPTTFEAAGLKGVSTRQQSNWIKGLINCGFLYTIDDKFYFGVKSKSKIYGLNYVGIIKSFPEEFAEYNSIYRGVESPKFISLSEYVTVDVLNDEHISNNVIIDNFNKDALNEFTKGTLSDFILKLNEYNSDKNDFNKKIFKFKYKNNKITGRAYSRYISTRKDEFFDTDRTEWKKENNLAYTYDIKSAVPRISHLLTTGEWKEPDFDFYSEMIKRANVNLLRDHIKSIHMRLRFGSTAKRSFNEFCFANKDFIKTNFKTREELSYFYNIIKPAMFIDWKKLYEIVEDLEGKDHSSAIFYFESYLELYVVWKLKQMGITAYNIYDEFFFDKECDIKSIIAEGANYVYERVKSFRRI